MMQVSTTTVPLFAIAVIEMVLLGPTADFGELVAWPARRTLLTTALTVTLCLALTVRRETAGFAIVVGWAAYLVTVIWRLRWLEPPSLRGWRVRHHWARRVRPWPRHQPLGVSVAVLMCAAITGNSVTAGLVAVGVISALTVRLSRTSIEAVRALAWPAAVLVSTTFVGVWVGGYAWIDSSDQSERLILTQLVAIELVLGVLPVTAILVAQQIVAGWIGLREVALSVRTASVVAIACLLTSLLLAVDLIGRKTVTVQLVETTQLAVAATLAVSIVAVIDVAINLNAFELTARLVERLDGHWLDYVRRTSNDYHRWWRRGDPLYALIAVLTRAALRDGESDTFVDGINELNRRLDEVSTHDRWDNNIEYRGPDTDVEVALDGYFAEVLRPLVSQLAERRMSWALEELMTIRTSIEPVATVWTGNRGIGGIAPAQFTGRRIDIPSGLRFHSMFVEQCLRRGMDIEASQAITQCSRYVARVLAHLPAYAEDQVAGPQRFEGTEYALEAYFDQLRSWGELAVRTGARESVDSLTWSTRRVVEEAMQLNDVGWARILTRLALLTDYSIAGHAAEIGVDAIAVPRFGGPPDPNNEVHLAVGREMLALVPDTVKSAVSGVGWWSIVSLTVMGLDLVELYPESLGVVADALIFVQGRGLLSRSVRERSQLETEIRARLDQLKRRSIELLLTRLAEWVSRQSVNSEVAAC
jgi:hypothetical protein